MALKIDSKAPDFTLPSTSGEDFNLYEDMAGKACVLYFYPKDFTSVCTAEACSFRDNFAQFRSADIPVIGISRDSVKTHLKFQEKYNLPFELLADPRGKVARLYKANLLLMTKRITYYLDENHVIKKVVDNMLDGETHIDGMIEMIEL
jgi:peroxiredoxin Q/BCP